MSVACVLTLTDPSRRSHPSMFDLFASAPAALCLARQDGIVTEVNPAWCRFVGSDEAALMGRPLALRFVADADHWSLREIAESSGVELCLDPHGERPNDGAEMRALLRVTELPGGDFICHLSETWNEDKAAEERRRYDLSHDLRTPMNIAQGYCELVLSTVEDPEIRDHIHTALAAIHTLKSLVEDRLERPSETGT